MNSSWVQAKIYLIQLVRCWPHQSFILWTMSTWTNLGDPLFAAFQKAKSVPSVRQNSAICEEVHLDQREGQGVLWTSALTLSAWRPWSRGPLAHRSPCWGHRAPSQPPRNPPGRRGWTPARRAARSGRVPGRERERGDRASERRTERESEQERERQWKRQTFDLIADTNYIRNSPPCYMKPACSNIR